MRVMRSAAWYHGLGQHVELLVLAPAADLDAHVVDGRASTRPSGANRLTYEQELVDRQSEVKIDPACPLQLARRLMASWGTPAALRSVLVICPGSP